MYRIDRLTIGGGPAGVMAAMYRARYRRRVIVAARCSHLVARFSQFERI
jgi:thioredoxin reductase